MPQRPSKFSAASQPIRAITVCVGYDDLLAITLPRNLRHLREILIVTTPEDTATQQLAGEHPGARLHVTDAFHRDGGPFNKGAALEEAFDRLGRRGWVLILDADTLLPFSGLGEMVIRPGFLYSPYRRLLRDPSRFRDDLDWSKLPLKTSRIWAGYFQLFHCSDPVLVERPWYPSMPTAGGCDGVFQSRWPGTRRIRPDLEVLHLGPHGRNWSGRVTPRISVQTV